MLYLYTKPSLVLDVGGTEAFHTLRLLWLWYMIV